jgi:hypothetical protein
LRPDQQCAVVGCDGRAAAIIKLVWKGHNEAVEEVEFNDVIAVLAEGNSVPLCGEDVQKVIELANALKDS